MWVTPRERMTLVIVGGLALAGLGFLVWQQHRPPLVVAGTPTLLQAVPWDEALRQSRRVDVNAATVTELERLPEVGPSLARRIVAYRTTHGRFLTAEELERVQGIGPKTYEALEDYVTAK